MSARAAETGSPGRAPSRLRPAPLTRDSSGRKALSSACAPLRGSLRFQWLVAPRAAVAALAVAAVMFAVPGCAPPSSRTTVAPAAGAALPVRGIAHDETWEGEVRIRGSVVVQKGATLTIRPGTIVRFERIDVDGDGIGDSELYVEGDLLAEGTAGRPIRFTSAERQPAPRDWKYLFVNLSRRTVLSHCVSEYAFSGVQIHFSRATVSRCLFRNCVDGFRFSTAEGTFERNTMTGNVYGVRYEERNSEAVLRRNEITGNKVGVFCVMESPGRIVIRENRIHGNADYDFKLGNRQRADIPARENWWGTTDAQAIRAKIFDRGREPELGAVLFEPFLRVPPPGPGEEGT